MAHREKEKGRRELGAQERGEGGKKGINEAGCVPDIIHHLHFFLSWKLKVDPYI